MAPASLAIIQASFRPEDRARAIGAWSGLGGVAAAAGPLVGGYLLAVASWRWVFFINLPVAALVVAVTSRHVPESRDPAADGRVDVWGASLAVAFLAGLTYALIEAPTRGWSDPAVLGGLALTALAGPVFVLVERRSSHPMLPLELFRSRQFSGANGVTFAVYGALGGALFLLPVELQLVAHYTPLESGLALFPLTLVMLTLSARSGQLSARIGPRLQMTVGPLIVAAGLALLVRATNPGSYLTQVFPAVLVFAFGLAVTVAPLTATAMGAAPTEHSGIASAVNNVVARAASLLAVAVLPLVAGLTGAAALAPEELAAGFRTAMLISGAVCALGAVVSALTIRNPGRARPAPAPAARAGPHLVVRGERAARGRRGGFAGLGGTARALRQRARPATVGQGRRMARRDSEWFGSGAGCARRLRTGHARTGDTAQPHHQGGDLRGPHAAGRGRGRAGRVPPPGRRGRSGHDDGRLPGGLARGPHGPALLHAQRGHRPGATPADRRRPRRGGGRGGPDRPRRSGGERPVERRTCALAFGRLHADGLARARHRRGGDRTGHRGLPSRRNVGGRGGLRQHRGARRAQLPA